VTMLGGASNVIVADKGIEGLVIQLDLTKVEAVNEPNSSANFQAEAGVKMALMVRKSIDLGLMGLEYFLGVPGTVGGAIYNNSHYLHHLIGEKIDRVEVMNEQGDITWLNQSECAFAYDESRFQHTSEIILSATWKLDAGDKEKSMQLVAEATRYRAATQPLGVPSSGCVFRNAAQTPELAALFPQFAQQSHVSAGFLIDQAGLKGTRVGGIEVSHKHAAFMINTGQGTAVQTQELIRKVKATVLEKFGVKLQEEVFYLPKSK
jgi:UDP-N-acetylmuramate dehydrogenase